MDLTELIARVEKATGPDRELDAIVAVAFDETNMGPEWGAHFKLPHKEDGCAAGTYWLCSRSGRSLRTAPTYTASLDAVLSLVEKRAADWTAWEMQIRSRQQKTSYTAALYRLNDYDGEDRALMSAPTPALAMLGALLLALAAQQKERG